MTSESTRRGIMSLWKSYCIVQQLQQGPKNIPVYISLYLLIISAEWSKSNSGKIKHGGQRTKLSSSPSQRDRAAACVSFSQV